MKYLFASLICHRDVEIFKFNWFCMRLHLDRGFDIPHLLLNDGSLTEADKQTLRNLPNVFLEEDPITLYDAPKAVLLGKLECLKRGFEKYDADRVIVFDCDIFFLRNWEGDLRKILTERTVVLRDWGSSIGPNVEKYKKLFGVQEDLTTPNCNTGVISVLKEDYHKIDTALRLHLGDSFLIMEDQGIMLAAFHGKLSYVNGIKCLINNIEYHSKMWEWAVSQNAVHLMGMRVRPDALKDLVNRSLQALPATVRLEQVSPIKQYISWGLLAYDHYNFLHPLQKLPSTFNGDYITDALYLHGGSEVEWKLASRFNRFTCQVVCMDSGIAENIKDLKINGIEFKLNSSVDIPLDGYLHITLGHGPGTHLALLSPRLHLDKSWPDLSLQAGP